MTAPHHDPPAAPAASSGADDRWAQAVSIAQGRPTPAAATDRRRRRTRTRALLIVVLVVCTGLGAALAVLFGGTAAETTPSRSRTVLQLVLSGVALVLLATGVVVNVRAGTWGARSRSALVVLGRAERREVLGQVRGRRDLDPDHPERLPVLLQVATGLAHPGGSLLVLAGVVVNTAAQVVGHPRSLFLVVLLVVVVLSLGAAVALGVRDQRAAQRFLEAHGPVGRSG